MSFKYVVAHGIETSPAIEGIGFTRSVEHSHFGPGKRKGYTIHYNINGTGYLNGNIVKKGQGFLIHDGMYAEHHADESDPWELLWVTMKGDCVEEIFAQCCADPSTKIFDFQLHRKVFEITDKICAQKSSSADALTLLNYFLELHLCCVSENAISQKRAASQIYLEEAQKYIECNVHRPVTVEELTSFIGVSQPYLYKLFKAGLDLSPKQYILKSKLEYAKSMLANNDMSISEIANSVGYDDVLCFSKMFSQKEKVSPKNYRNKTTA